MTDNKLTYEQVIPRLIHEVELAEEFGDVHSMMIQIGLIKDTLDLVKRQKAEIERLRHILVNFMGEIFEWGNKNDVDTRIFAQIAILDKEKDEAVKQIKAEAIKEFAERLKKIAIEKGSVPIVFVDIDNLVKEMVGDTE